MAVPLRCVRIRSRETVSHRGQVYMAVPLRCVRIRSRGISRLRSARSPRWRVFWDSRVRLVLFLMQGISRLTLEMTACSFCFIMLFCKYRHRRLAYDGSPSAPALVSTSLEMTGRWSVPYCFIMLICKYGHRRLAHRGSLSGGRGRPPLHNLSQVSTGFADLPTAARRRADEERDEERPYLMRLPLGDLSRSD